MNTKELIEQSLEDIGPMLQAAGRSIQVKEVTDNACVIEMSGFCGDCACTESYQEGIQEILQTKAPQIESIQFIKV